MPRLPGIRLGACYNIFDGEELLESSIQSIRSEVDYVVVVYQIVSNFGVSANDGLVEGLRDLQQMGLIDELVEYHPKEFSTEDRMQLLSEYSNVAMGEGGLASLGNQFFNELTKRNIGHQHCASTNCTHFISMDADEYYATSQIKFAKDFLIRNPEYNATACLMFQYFKSPYYRLNPVDKSAYVPFIYKITGNLPDVEGGVMFKLAHPFPVSVDPTRVLAGASRLKIFNENEVVMHHMSFVRTASGLLSKMTNVSNRSNYKLPAHEIVYNILNWTISDTAQVGELIPSTIPHPHPSLFGKFTHVLLVDNNFDVPETLLD
eukprot:TRINITY_DN36796_c0_g1_i1.p1 TRINITY_DN36796_c0_g1~~TRINITY_DN36796_c0_g1_i1.p1  ORF type:complete len:319 (+),score=55.59 TRINITY_DN36796_c0_g1_i1:145-1101(+)